VESVVEQAAPDVAVDQGSVDAAVGKDPDLAA
jgi:hypothetical protein